MTITVEDIRKDPKGYVLRLKSGQVLSLANWWILPLGDGVYLLDRGDWGGPAFHFKIEQDDHCVAQKEEGWIDIGVFEVSKIRGG